MIERIILIAIFLFPFQIVALRISSSRYDITCFILISLIYFNFLLRKIRIQQKYLIGVLIFFSFQVLVYTYLRIAPFERFLSGMIWFGSLLIIVAFSDYLQLLYRQKNIFKTIIITLSISIIYALLQHFQGDIQRPTAWFDEPSFAGLAFSALSAASFCTLLSNLKISRNQKILLLLIFITSTYSLYLTLSTHVLTFAITVFLFLVSKYFTQLSKLLSPQGILVTSITISALVIGLNFLATNEHFSSRIEDKDNISRLAWLNGMDQTFTSIKISPLGVGLGGTGFLDFSSENSLQLTLQGVAGLNHNDAYSLLFRMIIELGIPFVILCILLFSRKLFYFHKFINKKLVCDKQESEQILYTIFNLTFASTLIIGSLIKEPLYSSSILYTGVFIFSSIPLRDRETRNHSISKKFIPSFSMSTIDKSMDVK